ncbi:MAG TPA: hypothetical protein VI796_05780 [Candidatus Thermoplasmatota archaeon]|nr:hypothetical protein [Candidatus Thermoplasmatota archaeon]
MTEKIASGVVHESTPYAARPEPDAAELDRLRSKRDNARWNIVVGAGLMFLGSFNVGFAVGGALMVLYGGGATLYWGGRYRKLKGDPWDPDPEIDEAEKEIFGR